MTATTVVSVRGKDRDVLLADSSFVYIGRACYGWPASPFGNPFKPTRDTLVYIGDPPPWNAVAKRIAAQQCLALFASCLRYAANEPWATMRRRLPELKGKRLCCWCGDWRPGEPEILCHGVVLAKAADALVIPPAVSRDRVG